MTRSDRDKLVTDNLRLVYYLYEKLTKNKLTRQYKDDIISEGMVGLVKAAKTFDDKRKIKFGTYASRCITNEMLMFIRRMNKQLPHEVSLYDPIGRDEDGHLIFYMDILSTDEESVREQGRIIDAVRNLPKRDREIIDAVMSGFKQKEIAAMMGVKQSTISRRISRIKKELKRNI